MPSKSKKYSKATALRRKANKGGVDPGRPPLYLDEDTVTPNVDQDTEDQERTEDSKTQVKEAARLPNETQTAGVKDEMRTEDSKTTVQEAARLPNETQTAGVKAEKPNGNIKAQEAAGEPVLEEEAEGMSVVADAVVKLGVTDPDMPDLIEPNDSNSLDDQQANSTPAQHDAVPVENSELTNAFEVLDAATALSISNPTPPAKEPSQPTIRDDGIRVRLSEGHTTIGTASSEEPGNTSDFSPETPRHNTIRAGSTPYSLKALQPESLTPEPGSFSTAPKSSSSAEGPETIYDIDVESFPPPYREYLATPEGQEWSESPKGQEWLALVHAHQQLNKGGDEHDDDDTEDEADAEPNEEQVAQSSKSKGKQPIRPSHNQEAAGPSTSLPTSSPTTADTEQAVLDADALEAIHKSARVRSGIVFAMYALLARRDAADEQFTLLATITSQYMSLDPMLLSDAHAENITIFLSAAAHHTSLFDRVAAWFDAHPNIQLRAYTGIITVAEATELHLLRSEIMQMQRLLNGTMARQKDVDELAAADMAEKAFEKIAF